MRSLAIRCSACAGLSVAGRGLRMSPPKLETRPIHPSEGLDDRKLTIKGPNSKLSAQKEIHLRAGKDSLSLVHRYAARGRAHIRDQR